MKYIYILEVIYSALTMTMFCVVEEIQIYLIIRLLDPENLYIT